MEGGSIENVSPLASSFGPKVSSSAFASSRAKRGGGLSQPFIIGVCGASASGKTSVCNKILDQFKFTQSVTIISLDSFYKELNAQEKEVCARGDYDFDSPNAFDWKLLFEKLEALRSIPPKSVEIPTYDFCTHSRTSTTTSIFGVDIVLLEGILTFHDEKVRNAFDMKIYVETDSDTCLGRRVIRDMEHRGRDLEGILIQYERFVKPGYDNFVSPQKRYADIIIPRGAENTVAISVIVDTIKSKLQTTPVSKYSNRVWG